MEKIIKSLFISVLLLVLTFSGIAQNTTIVVSNSAEKPGQIINVKWIGESIIYDEGVNLYRREEGTPIWLKVNETPILKGQYMPSSEIINSDSSLQTYINMIENTSSSEIQGLAKALILIKIVYSNEYSKFLGIHFDDTSATPGKTYRYMVKRIKGDKEVFESVSETITLGSFVSEKSPQEVRVEAGDKKVNFWWKVEDKRFHSVNIYRFTQENSEKTLVTQKPIILTTRKGPDGKNGYPDVFFVDKTVKNGVSYFYQLAGIDFFGRETELSAEVMVTPVNRTPPPAPKFLDSKVKLLEVNLVWEPDLSKKVVGLHIYRTSSIYKPFERVTKEMLNPVVMKYTDKLQEPGNYYYYVASVDKEGNEGKSNMTMAQSLDIYPPPIPQNLSVIADSGQITLKWDGVKAKDLIGYRLYRTVDADNEDFYALMNAYPVEDTVFVDSLPFNARNRFFYRIVSVDSALNMSDYSNPASAKMPDVVPPDAPFIKEIKIIDGEALDINWLPNLDADLLGFQVFREEIIDSSVIATRLNNQIIEANKLNYVDLTAIKNTEYKYFIRAIDSVGNMSVESNRYQAIIESRVIEEPVALKNINSKYIRANHQAWIRWQVPLNQTIKGVVIFRKNAETGSFVPISGLVKGNDFKDDLPKEGKQFIYKLTAYTNSGVKWASREFEVLIEDE